MTTKIQCPKCGADNIPSGIFCFECGASIKTTHAKSSVENTFHDPNLEKTLATLLDSNGYVNISVGKYYVQLLNDSEDNTVYFEALSDSYLPTMKIYENEFYYLGFQRQSKTNFYKHIAHDDFEIATIINEIVYIFEKIYKVEFKNYFLQIENDNQSDIIQANTIFSDPKKVRSVMNFIGIVFYLSLVFYVHW